MLTTLVLLAVAPASPVMVLVDGKRPPCDYTIRSAADWSHVNDSDKRIICVAPGATYTVEQVDVVKLTASGTADNPRWLRWDRNDDVHPANVSAAETAAVSQFDVNGNNWIIDRLVVRDAIYQPNVNGTGNLLNQMVFEKPRAWSGRANGLMLRFGTGSINSVRDSVFRHPWRAQGKDSYAVYVDGASRISIVGNELIDLPSNLQNGPGAGGGLVYMNNEMYHTSANYTDCRGNFTPTGACSCAEGMGVVPKGPSSQAMSYIENNFIWGFKPSDQYCAGTGTPGVAIDLGGGGQMARNFMIRNNTIVASTPYGIYLGRYVEDVTISKNYLSGVGTGISNTYGQRITVTDNLYYNNGTNYGTSSVATGTISSGNRQATSGERCETTRHLTAPKQICYP